MKRLLILVLSCVALLATLLAPTPASAQSLPVKYDFPTGAALGVANPNASPPGANDWSCRPSAAHPRPVVLVHGTVENMALNFNAVSPLLKNNGYCVYAFNYGGSYAGTFFGVNAIASSAAELGTFVDRVRAATGSAKVDIVGHSQGGMMPRHYINFLGGAAKVNALVGLAPDNHGTTLQGIAELGNAIPFAPDVVAFFGPSLRDQMIGSPFITALNAQGETRPGVKYTVITTKYDEVVTPYTSGFLTAGPGATVKNITVQDGCWLNFSEHLSIAYDRRALTYMLNALDPANPRSVPCTLSLPLVGG